MSSTRATLWRMTVWKYCSLDMEGEFVHSRCAISNAQFLVSTRHFSVLMHPLVRPSFSMKLEQELQLLFGQNLRAAGGDGTLSFEKYSKSVLQRTGRRALVF